MTTSSTLVVELLTEELPPKALKTLGEAFAGTLSEQLRRLGYLTGSSAVTSFATPRRLAVSITGVLQKAPDQDISVKLMPAQVAWGPDGLPSAAYRKKLDGMGLGHLATAAREVDAGTIRIFVASDAKADSVHLRRVVEGRELARGLNDALGAALEGLPIPKVMSYRPPAGPAGPAGYFNSVKFVRPAHGLVALHGADVVPVGALGLAAGRHTDGHRFMSRSGIAIAHADGYEATLEAEGKTIPSFAKRREAIVGALDREARGSTVIMPSALLDEVTSLVEWPVVYAGTFDAAFLEVPQECLILTMQQNQKYFALAGGDGRLQNRFLLVSNLETSDPGEIVRGNERVLRARLADARFFYQQDRKTPLSDRLPKLASVVYHNKLGTQAERVDRLRFLATRIAPSVGADPDEARRAAALAKADLTTDMVGEFPELQGVMGRYYALHDGEPAPIADAVMQHYWPRFAGDALPEGPVAQAVALADKLEALAGLFGIGQVPTGDKDPFGLRRAALGVLRILIEKRVAVSLDDLVNLAFSAFPKGMLGSADADVVGFLLDRLRGYLREQGATPQQIEAVLATNSLAIDLVPHQLAAVQAFARLPEAAALAAANKRIVNILRKSGAEAAIAVERTLLGAGAESDLFDAFEQLHPAVESHYARGDYTSALMELATAKPVVDRFFDEVMVMADDPRVRGNRLALLRGVAATMNRVADIAMLAT